MTGIEKRNMVVTEVITPVLKQAGFKKSGLSWWMELEDSCLIIRMRNSRFNRGDTGINFDFQLSASAKKDMQGKPKDQWIYNQFTSRLICL